MIPNRLDFFLIRMFLLWGSITSALANSFFIDKGHTDVVNGIAFEIVQPHLFIKKAFHLREQNLTPLQLRAIRDAMPAIASMTQNVLNRSSEVTMEGGPLPKPRSIYEMQNIESPTQLFILALKNWQVTETSIQFSSDYFYSPHRGPMMNFRDSYVFTKTAQGWRFLKHPHSTPDGLLVCKKSADAWMRCELAPPP